MELFDPIGWEIGALEHWAEQAGFSTVLGVDEAGRGPLAGPVVAAAVILDIDRARREGWLDEVADSKVLDPEQRDDLFERIRRSARHCALAQAEAHEIDRLNILQATLVAMSRAVREALRACTLQRVLIAVDGNTPIPGLAPQQTLVKGDARSFHIAAASILAKVSRDRILERYDEIWPEYGFARHKGYPTPSHRKRLLRLGHTPVHRRTFRVTEP